jgi:flagellar FliJ protein
MDNANLSMLIELARSARDAAATRHGQVRAALEQARTQLDTLRNYSREYERRAQNTLTQGIDPAAQDNQRAFLAKLTRAITAQAAEVQRREGQLAAADVELLQMRQRLMSLEKLAERQERLVQKTHARREQKATDEFAQRQRPNTEQPMLLDW